MSSASAEHLRRQKVLEDLNSRLTADSKVGLNITGHRIPIQDLQAKPSRIPTPEAPARPLPSIGYVAESISLHHAPRLPRPSNDEAPPISSAQSPHTAPHTKSITIEIKGLPEYKEPLSKASVVECGGSSTQRTVAIHSRSMKSAESRKRELIASKGSTRKKYQTKSDAAYRKSNSCGTAGRLNVLRIRYITRKYYRLWCTHIYGRVLPSEVRRHHEHCLKRRAMATWREVWWQARREWKLNIRAECHNRYRLWQKVWYVWTEYVRASQSGRRKKELAHTLASRRLLNQAWKGWSQYVLVRREKERMKVQVEQWNVMRMKRTSWCKWRCSLEEKRQFLSMDTLALHHWALQLQKKALYSWLQHYHERILLQHRTTIATHHWRRNMIGRCLGAWLSYIHRRSVKHQMRGVASQHHKLMLAVKTFCCWKKRYVRARQIADFQELVTVKGQSAILRRAVQRWKHYIILKHYKHQLKELASRHYSLMLKSKVVHVLQAYVCMQQRQAHDSHLAQQFHIKKRMQHCWAVWLQCCEHCEEIKLGPKTRTARSHYAVKLKRMVVGGWLQYTTRRVERKEQYSMADQHFKAVSLPNCFAAMKTFVTIQHHIKQLKEQSSSFRRENLLSMAFYRWWREAQLSQDVRMLERMAILHREEVLKKRLLKLWRSRTRERMRHHSNEERAVAHHYYFVVGGAFQKWKLNHQNAVKLERQIKLAAKHHDHKLAHLVWTTWTKYVVGRRLSHLKKANAIQCCNKLLLRNVLEAWKEYHSRVLVEKAKKLKADQLHQSKLRKKTFSWWHEGIQMCKNSRRQLHQATSFNKVSMLSKHFSLWLERTAKAVDQKQAEDEMLHESLVQLQRLKLFQIFTLWRKRVSFNTAQRLSEERAQLHHKKNMLAKCLTAWHTYHRLQLRKTLLQRQGVWFENTRLLSLTYARWRVQLMHTLVLKKKNSMALWHWSQTLERRVVAAWLLYTLKKKRKSKRYAKAIERHRKSLVTIGVRQWIRVASQMQTQREETALQKQLNTTQAVMSCVRKCALQWRRVVRERRLNTQAVSCSIAATSIPSQQLEPSRKTHPSSSDFWNSLARQLKIPDGVALSRPPPRRSVHLRQPPFPNDAIPRVPSLALPSLHPLSSDVAKENDSFMSRASSCCDTGFNNESTTHGEHFQQQAERSVMLPTHKICDQNLSLVDVHSLTKRDIVANSPPSSKHHSPLAHLPPQPSLTLTSTFEGPRSVCHDQTKPSPVPEGQGLVSGVAVDLSSPNTQMEIVQMRDELKRFHDLKLHHKKLERQLIMRMGQDDTEAVAELEEELRSISEQVKQCTPIVHVIASKVKHLLSQS